MYWRIITYKRNCTHQPFCALVCKCKWKLYNVKSHLLRNCTLMHIMDDDHEWKSKAVLSKNTSESPSRSIRAYKTVCYKVYLSVGEGNVHIWSTPRPRRQFPPHCSECFRASAFLLSALPWSRLRQKVDKYNCKAHFWYGGFAATCPHKKPSAQGWPPEWQSRETKDGRRETCGNY